MEEGGKRARGAEEKLWGEFKNGHILNGRSKLRPTGLENRTHKFSVLDMFHCFSRSSPLSPSLSFYPPLSLTLLHSNASKHTRTHTGLPHFLNQDNKEEVKSRDY